MLIQDFLFEIGHSLCIQRLLQPPTPLPPPPPPAPVLREKSKKFSRRDVAAVHSTYIFSLIFKGG